MLPEPVLPAPAAELKTDPPTASLLTSLNAKVIVLAAFLVGLIKKSSLLFIVPLAWEMLSPSTVCGKLENVCTFWSLTRVTR